ncbi:MAG: 50S ribosomal protein L1 [bacterium ADurb.Bin212]|nr:MAG: 50S ribosomal protein L1 [bacterium ADurb.Bin212]
MPEEKKKPVAKKVKKEQVVEEAVSDKEVDEKELLHEAEEREKERKEAEEREKEQAKEAAKESKSKERTVKKLSRANVRVKPKHGKKYREVMKKIEIGKEYSIPEAIKLAKETSITKFEATIELHIKLSKKLENIRGTFTLPGGAVKEKKVLTVDDKNIEEVIAKVKSGKIDFDIMVAHPSVMPRLASMAKTLGPKGLMPNPKAGTVSEDVKSAAEEFKGGRIEYKADKSNNIHIAVAKAKLADDKIQANIDAAISQFPANKIESIHLTTSMGPSIRVSVK